MSSGVLGAASLLPGLALAHHPMGGKLPTTFFQGLLSGLAHPIIGLDHFAMLLLVGVYCGVQRQGLRPVAAFVGAGLIGCLLHVARLDLPRAETWLAVSLVLAGIAACAVTRASRSATTIALSLAGLLHGYAYGEAIVGTGSAPLLAYLLGLALVQLALTGGVARLVRARTTDAALDQGRLLVLVRATGIASALVGVWALA